MERDDQRDVSEAHLLQNSLLLLLRKEIRDVECRRWQTLDASVLECCGESYSHVKVKLLLLGA